MISTQFPTENLVTASWLLPNAVRLSVGATNSLNYRLAIHY